MRLLASGIQELQKELGETGRHPLAFFASQLLRSHPANRIRRSPTCYVGSMLFGPLVVAYSFFANALYHMTSLVHRYTQAPVRFVAGLSLIVRTLEDVYGNLEGKLLEALSRLFAQNVRIYAYPMIATDLRERLKDVSDSGWEWSETNGLV